MEKLRCDIENLKRKASNVSKELCEILNEISALTEAQLNSLPQNTPWGSAGSEAGKNSVPSAYRFLSELSASLARFSGKREELLSLSEALDALSAACPYELSREILALGELLIELQRKIGEAEDVSGRFVGGFDKFSDLRHRGENADLGGTRRICREYFDFTVKTRFYIDNLKKI